MTLGLASGLDARDVRPREPGVVGRAPRSEALLGAHLEVDGLSEEVERLTGTGVTAARAPDDARRQSLESDSLLGELRGDSQGFHFEERSSRRPRREGRRAPRTRPKKGPLV